MVSEKLDQEHLKKVIPSSPRYKRKLVLEKVNKAGRRLGEYIGKKKYAKSKGKGKEVPFYYDDGSENPLMVMLPQSTDPNKCKENKHVRCCI